MCIYIASMTGCALCEMHVDAKRESVCRERKHAILLLYANKFTKA